MRQPEANPKQRQQAAVVGWLIEVGQDHYGASRQAVGLLRLILVKYRGRELPIQAGLCYTFVIMMVVTQALNASPEGGLP